MRVKYFIYEYTKIHIKKAYYNFTQQKSLYIRGFLNSMSRWQDSNLRPPAPKIWGVDNPCPSKKISYKLYLVEVFFVEVEVFQDYSIKVYLKTSS